MNDDLDRTARVGELVILHGPGQGTPLPFHAPVVLIGRSPDCDHRFDDLTVRSIHCIISRTNTGLHLRAIGGDCQVNGLQTVARDLADGDVLDLGTTQVEVVFHRPVPLDPSPSVRKKAPWREQLARARARLVRERRNLRADFGRQLAALTATRRDVEEQRSANAAQRERLRDLRRRFIRRWKQHWTAERARLHAEQQKLRSERDEAIRQREILLDDHDHRHAELSTREAAVLLREANLELREREAQEELNRLEERIRHAREALPADPIVPVANPDVPDVPELAMRRHLLERIAEEMADQRQVLFEHASRLTEVADQVRREGAEVAEALTGLIQEYGRQELLATNEASRLDAWHARLVVREADVDRREDEVASREEASRRRESTLGRMAQRWQKQREEANRRVFEDIEHVRLMRLRADLPPSMPETWALEAIARKTTERLALIARLEQELTDREIDFERKQAEMQLAADADAVMQFQRKAALAQAEKQIADLRAEIERLATALERYTSPNHRRAA